MATIVKSLYPPIVDTYMPAFIVNNGQGACKLYFSLSKYNNLSEIKSIWVTINNQYTNEPMINNNIGMIKFNFAEILKDSEENKDSRPGDDRYYITINETQIKGGWELNQLYKVQLRFCEVDLKTETMSEIIANENNFSEWSTVTLIRGIQQPKLTLLNFKEENEVIFTATNNVFAGRVDNLHSDDSLVYYQIKIVDKRNLNKIIYDSGICYTNEYNPNEINHFVKKGFADGESYIVKITYETASLFRETKEFSFSVIDIGRDTLNAVITAEPNDEDGYIKINIYSKEMDNFIGNLTIRRASSKNNFEIWEDVYTTTVMSIDERLNVSWNDYTVESGIWYKYCVQKRNNHGERGLVIMLNSPVMVTLQDMFLTTADKQLKIKFNPQVNSFKHTLSDSLTQTLGSKYPFIKRNGNVNFRQFSISGLISHFCDENELFCSKDELYQGQTSLYNKYNEQHRITEYNDFSLERAFREKVQEFLYANEVKLFRSPTEGNILVRLMDVSFTPNTTLGRMVYSFSATAYEIDEINFETLDKYNIQKVGTYQESFFRTYTKKYQIKEKFVVSRNGVHEVVNIKNFIQNYENENAIEGTKKVVNTFNDIDISFESEPYLINVGGSTPVPISNANESNNATDIVLGYLISVNGEWFVVSSRGRFTLTGDDVKITSLSLIVPGISGYELNVLMKCSYEVQEMEDTSDAIKQIVYSSRVGQIRGDCDSTTSLYNIISKKYEYQTNANYQRMYALNSVTVEVEPNTVFYLKNVSSNSYNKYMVGKSGILNIVSEDYDIDGLYILGPHLEEQPKEHIRIKDLEFKINDEEIYDTVSHIMSPEKNNVYFVRDISEINFNLSLNEARKNDYLTKLYNLTSMVFNNSREEYAYRVIYYQDNWYLFSKEDDVIKTNQFLIDYYYELEKGVFADV